MSFLSEIQISQSSLQSMAVKNFLSLKIIILSLDFLFFLYSMRTKI